MWKPIIGYEGLYEVSDRGQVRSLARRVPHPASGYLTVKERILTLNIELSPSVPYQYVFLSKNGKVRRFRVHSLVLLMFAGPCPDKMICRHLNGDPADNRWPENLLWGTSKENMADEYLHGGTPVRNFKLSQEKADEIRLLRGKTQKEIAKIYGVSPATISLVQRGTTWTA